MVGVGLHNGSRQQGDNRQDGDNRQVLKQQYRKNRLSRGGIQQAFLAQGLQDDGRGREGQRQADGDGLLPWQNKRTDQADNDEGEHHLGAAHT